MGAYNWIEIRNSCPSCNKDSTIKCQTHFCSDYDGDDSGRFHDRTYQLGDRMSWWPSLDPRYKDYSESNSDGSDGHGKDTECCYSECLSCHTGLFVVIRFDECTPAEVLDIGVENEWPKGYLK